MPSNPPLPDAPDTSWIVYRVDDNGNSFVVKTELTQAEAEQLLAHYETLHHKQTYWIKPAKQSP